MLETETQSKSDDYWYEIKYGGERRAITWTAKSAIAFGPRFTQIGDDVCILHGSTVPIVLRPSGDQWHVIGQCYLDEVMLGEACTWSENEARTFDLT